MKVLQPKLALGTEGKILIDTTNLRSKSNSSTKKRKGENVENAQPRKVIRKDGIYSDAPVSTKQTTLIDSSTQTASSFIISEDREAQRVKDMLSCEHPPPEYWKSLAEKRKQTLEITLEDNRFLKEENDFLKGENKMLEEMLEEAKQLATLVQEITDEKDSRKGVFSS